uniref:SKP1 component dimerisation domain-containing protein n=1 Tax=Arcella intermedia TaxID=1963864 RepID=A0A6B2LPX2_9EUKA
MSIAKQFGIFSVDLETMGCGCLDVDKVIEKEFNLTTINGNTLEKMLEFSRLEMKLKGLKRKQRSEELQKELLKDQETILALMVAADTVSFPSLLDETARIVALMIKGKSSTEIRKIFNIQTDVTQEERNGEERK